MSSLFDDYCHRGPESKLELIDGRLVVGNNLIGSKLLLNYILKGWGTEAAVALAPVDLWENALKLAYGAPENLNWRDISTVRTWARQVGCHPQDLSAGEAGRTWEHNQIRQRLTLELFQINRRGWGRSLGRDFVMRLGENGFTPDLLFVAGHSLKRMQSWYLEEAADIVIEVLLPNHTVQDQEIKRALYASGGIREYWLIDPQSQTVEFLRLEGGEYQLQSPDADGHYRPPNIPGLAFVVSRLWECDREYRHLSGEHPLFEVELSEEEWARECVQIQEDREDRGVVWESLPFNPQLDLKPVPIRFEEYIAWCPEAKFEYSGKPDIGGKTGIKHLLGMLIGTFGMVETAKLLSANDWLTGIYEAKRFYHRDEARKQWWWKLARAAAEFLRERYSATRLGVIGDLVQPEPLNFWSEITLVTWDIPEFSEAAYEVFLLTKDLEINLLELDRATLVQQQMIETELVEI